MAGTGHPRRQADSAMAWRWRVNAGPLASGPARRQAAGRSGFFMAGDPPEPAARLTHSCWLRSAAGGPDTGWTSRGRMDNLRRLPKCRDSVNLSVLRSLSVGWALEMVALMCGVVVGFFGWWSGGAARGCDYQR